MQSSSFDNMGINPSLFTDNVGEFNFYVKKKKKTVVTHALFLIQL